MNKTAGFAGGTFIWFKGSPYETYWSNASDYAVLKKIIANSSLTRFSCRSCLRFINSCQFSGTAYWFPLTGGRERFFSDRDWNCMVSPD